MPTYLTLNPGSTTLKGAVFIDGKKLHTFTLPLTKNFHTTLLIEIKKLNIASFHHLDACIIRIVHGGTHFQQPFHITAAALTYLKKTTELAPLHNAPALTVITTLRQLFPKTKLYGICDTAFHATIPHHASTYALPRDLVKKYSLKKYGFHGIVCQDILHSFTKIPKKIIICHLGGGCSITAIRDGASIDTTMGFTPLAGVPMMTRSGDIDAGLIHYLSHHQHITSRHMQDILYHQSGMHGLTGTSDMQEILQTAEQGSTPHLLALDHFIYQITLRISSYIGALGGLDALVFSGGIGAGSPTLRQRICDQLKFFGIKIDQQKNKHPIATLTKISTPNSRITLYATKIDEAAEMVRQIMGMKK